ncbi:MAG: FG-GAP-like repeat-containing protein [Myxococcota bacterium]
MRHLVTLVVLTLVGCECAPPAQCTADCAPTAECVDSTLVVRTPAGCGAKGECLFDTSSVRCDFGCAAGRCLPGPDAGDCAFGTHHCDGACVADDDVATCGARCTPCPQTTGGRATCTAGACGFECLAPFIACPTGCCEPAGCVDGGVCLARCGDDAGVAPSAVGALVTTSLAALGDFDGDGALDLAVGPGGSASDTTLVWRGRGARFEEPPTPLLVSGDTKALVALDLDRDGVDELLALSRVIEVLGRDGGALARRVELDVLDGVLAGAKTAVRLDTNRDGVPELAVAEGARLHVFDVRDGGLSRRASLDAGVFALAAGDLDGDGDDDLVFADGQGTTVTRFDSLADGGFGPPVSIDVGAQPEGLAVGHLAPSAPAQLAVATVSGVVVVNGMGPSSLGGPGCEALVIADTDGDGRNELVCRGSGEVTRYSPTDGWAPRGQPLGTSAGDFFLRAADLDGDARAELVCSVLDAIVVLPGSPGGPQWPQPAPLAQPARALLGGDLDGDGRGDLALVNGSNVVEVRYGDPLQLGAATFLDAGAPREQLVEADVDGDGRLDLVTAGPGGLITLRAVGPRRFAPATSSAGCAATWRLAVVDVEGDGQAELVESCRTTDTVALRGWRDGGLALVGTLTNTAHSAVPVAGDFTGDGRADLLVARDDSLPGLSLWRGAGDGGFVFERLVGTSVGASSLASGDLDGDGLDDVAVVSTHFASSWATSVVFSGDAGVEVGLVTSARPSMVTLVDLDADGRLDVVVGRPEGTISYLRNAGGRRFEGYRPLFLGPGPALVSATDVDGDGRPELLSTTTADGGGLGVLDGTCVPR